MRSHAFRALTLIVAGSALTACGESVDVGNFEDGTGGAGGGGPATSTSTGGDAPTTTATTSSGTQSTTTSSSGGGSCEELGGQCLVDASDAGEPAVCETIGMIALEGACSAVNEACCGATPTCDADADCAGDKRCNPCAHGSCPECDDCVPACVPHACDPGPEPLCDAIRPECGDGSTAVVRDGCYVCVDLETCEPPAPSECDADFDCDADAWCDPCGTSSCPDCDDCVAACVPHGCDSGSEAECLIVRPDCGSGRTAVVRDGCFVCVELDTCEPPAPTACTDAGGQCLSDPGDPGFPALCGDLGLVDVDASCGDAINLACCARPCGGLLGETCSDSEYCDIEDDGCGFDDGQGICKPRPATCQGEPREAVCSCSGDNFPSACEAAQQGFDVWGGEDFCPAPVFCGGQAQIPCEDDEFCDYANDACGALDDLGVCRPRPTDCPEPQDGEETCGCDYNLTYDSVCEANRAGLDASSATPLECGGA